MRLLFPFALYLTAMAYQDPTPIGRVPQVNRYRDSACAEVRGLKDADCGNLPKEKPMSHVAEKSPMEDLREKYRGLEHELHNLRPQYNALLVENERLKAKAREAEHMRDEYYGQLQRIKAALAGDPQPLPVAMLTSEGMPVFPRERWEPEL